jgi:hypothetical protein
MLPLTVITYAAPRLVIACAVSACVCIASYAGMFVMPMPPPSAVLRMAWCGAAAA